MWQTLQQKHHLTVKRDDARKTLFQSGSIQLRSWRRFVRRGYVTAGPTKCGMLMATINWNPSELPSVVALMAFRGKLCGSRVAALIMIQGSLRSIICSVYQSLDNFQPAFAQTVELKMAPWQPFTVADRNILMTLQEPSVTCMVPQLQTKESKVGGLSLESKGTGLLKSFPRAYM